MTGITRAPSGNRRVGRRRRVSPTMESTSPVVTRALPHGYVRPKSQAHWRHHARRTLASAGLRADRHGTLSAVASALMRWADWETLTSRPTWAVLIAYCNRATGRGSRATIARAIAQLIELQLIARVAHGRLGRYAGGPHPARNPNDAALYVLIVPASASRGGAPKAHDRAAKASNETPPNLELSEALPVRAHARPPAHSEPLRGNHVQAATHASSAGQVIPNRHEPMWPAWATTSSKGARFAAAAELQRRLPVLRQISTRDVRSCLRPFLLAGWTVRDIEHALDTTPHGNRWPHDGATGVGPHGVRGWIAHRLSPWTFNGTPRNSCTQQADAERSHSQALERGRREREAAERAANPVVGAPPLKYRQARAHMPHVRLEWTDPTCPLCAVASRPLEPAVCLPVEREPTWSYPAERDRPAEGSWEPGHQDANRLSVHTAVKLYYGA